MNALSVVTSFSERGWHEYGRRFCATFFEYWPKNVALHIASEDMDAVAVRDSAEHALEFHFHPLDNPFIQRFARDKRAQGREQHASDVGWTPKKLADGYNFRYDAYRFAKKVFAIEAAAAQCYAGGRLFWVDADVVTFEPVPLDLLERLLPDDVALSCLDRQPYHSECGFVGYNLSHPAARGFIRDFAQLYEGGEVFGLREWHDSWVFDWLRLNMQVPTYAIPHCSKKQPFINSELGRYMDHMKGSNKALGRTPQHLMVAGHGHRYWRDSA